MVSKIKGASKARKPAHRQPRARRQHATVTAATIIPLFNDGPLTPAEFADMVAEAHMDTSAAFDTVQALLASGELALSADNTLVGLPGSVDVSTDSPDTDDGMPADLEAALRSMMSSTDFQPDSADDEDGADNTDLESDFPG